MRSFVFILIFIFCAFEVFSDPPHAPITPHHRNKTEFRVCEIAAAMVFQNEGPYLKEWIEYHKLIGIKHFYLYNNLSQDNYLEILQPYIEEGVVELFDFPEKVFNQSGNVFPTQVIVYNHALRIAERNNRWLAIIDSDEFICPVKKKKLSKVLQAYWIYGGVCIFWQMYGTSNIPSLQPGELMIEKLIFKMAPASYEGSVFKTFKSIVRPECVKQMLSAHVAEYRYGYSAVFPDHQPMFYSPLPYNENLPIDEIRINHYAWRTEDYFYNIKLPRMKSKNYAPGSIAIPLSISTLMDSCNAVEDRIMDKYIPELRKVMSTQLITE